MKQKKNNKSNYYSLVSRTLMIHSYDYFLKPVKYKITFQIQKRSSDEPLVKKSAVRSIKFDQELDPKEETPSFIMVSCCMTKLNQKPKQFCNWLMQLNIAFLKKQLIFQYGFF